MFTCRPVDVNSRLILSVYSDGASVVCFCCCCCCCVLLTWARNVPLLENSRTCFWGPFSLLLNRYRAFFSRSIAAGTLRSVTPPSDELKNLSSYTSTPLYFSVKALPLPSCHYNYGWNVTGKVAGKFQEKRRTTKHTLNRVWYTKWSNNAEHSVCGTKHVQQQFRTTAILVTPCLRLLPIHLGSLNPLLLSLSLLSPRWRETGSVAFTTAHFPYGHNATHQPTQTVSHVSTPKPAAF